VFQLKQYSKQQFTVSLLLFGIAEIPFLCRQTCKLWHWNIEMGMWAMTKMARPRFEGCMSGGRGKKSDGEGATNITE